MLDPSILDTRLIVNLALETQKALEDINVTVSQVTHVKFYNHYEKRMEQCSYDIFDQVAKDIWYPRSPDGENYRVIQPDLEIHVEDGFLQRATEEDGVDGWTSVGFSYSLVDYVPPVGTLLPEFIKYTNGESK